jgi:hypothetical protein
MSKIIVHLNYVIKAFTSMKALDKHFYGLLACYDTPQGMDRVEYESSNALALAKEGYNFIRIDFDNKTIHKEKIKLDVLKAYLKLGLHRLYKVR